MKFIETGFKDLWLIEPKIFGDSRGYFYESFTLQVFRDKGIDVDFLQDNQSLSKAGTIRGLHFQRPPYAQGKLVRVISGSVLDVAVDLRKSSKTFGKHYSVELSGENKRMLWIPAGFAHGFSCLEDDTIFMYKCTAYYNKDSEATIHYADPDLGIDWKVKAPVVSDKDKLGLHFKTIDSPFR
jgi:dTDP-4-dehydrorhamnose 3,5-epimerase